MGIPFQALVIILNLGTSTIVGTSLASLVFVRPSQEKGEER
jgi:hypothetical protein